MYLILVKPMVFPVVMYGCESLIIKNSEHQSIDAFKLWCWRRLLDSKEIKPVNPIWNHPWIFIGRTDTEWSSNILATWGEEQTLWKRPCFWERWKAGGEGDDRRQDGWMTSLIQWTWVWLNSGRWWRTGNTGVLQSMGSQRVRHNWVTEQQLGLNCPHYFSFLDIVSFISFF